MSAGHSYLHSRLVKNVITLSFSRTAVAMKLNRFSAGNKVPVLKRMTAPEKNIHCMREWSGKCENAV
jgi:hypothetical protein